jgi:hypothetical protein
LQWDFDLSSIIAFALSGFSTLFAEFIYLCAVHSLQQHISSQMLLLRQYHQTTTDSKPRCESPLSHRVGDIIYDRFGLFHVS